MLAAFLALENHVILLTALAVSSVFGNGTADAFCKLNSLHPKLQALERRQKCFMRESTRQQTTVFSLTDLLSSYFAFI